ncbi:unnamed protein product [Albugo candida]|uniref:Uncharacterized protein n=1 Tax=Albugo candida TaxID=65357 RepID=A0A024G6R5_9STRA|nr:unnamed protein product [Albugo candida]|eukprot:CCI42259.1 unnamed protein product [Albugo candida]
MTDSSIVVFPINKLAAPFDPVFIFMHVLVPVMVPSAVICGTIGPVIGSISQKLVSLKFSLISRSRCKSISSDSMHFIIFPISFVRFRSDYIRTFAVSADPFILIDILAL